MNPTLEEVADIRTAVSEAVTNAIIHGYPDEVRTVIVRARLTDQLLELWVSDEGTGIANVQKAMEPLYTTRPELERSGMGFMFMEAFMDQIHVESAPGRRDDGLYEKADRASGYITGGFISLWKTRCF